ncbi:MAG: hypothetical protein U0T74_12965 [Chitinophagales bacterium]
MKTTMKKIVLATVTVAFFALSSCEKHTCPTYSKNVTKSERVNS